MMPSFLDKQFSDKSFDVPEILKPQVVIPALMLVPYAFLPEGPALFIIAAYFLFHLDICFGLTFDGFMRFSRYRLSQKHPVLDMIASISAIAACFLGLSPLALMMKSYSLVVSPGEDSKGASIYDASFVIPFMQALVLLAVYIITYYKYGF